jgi:hypothetical protein
MTGDASRVGTRTGTARPPWFIEAMTASATAPAVSPSWAVASGDGRPVVTASIQACSSTR